MNNTSNNEENGKCEIVETQPGEPKHLAKNKKDNYNQSVLLDHQIEQKQREKKALEDEIKKREAEIEELKKKRKRNNVKLIVLCALLGVVVVIQGLLYARLRRVNTFTEDYYSIKLENVSLKEKNSMLQSKLIDQIKDDNSNGKCESVQSLYKVYQDVFGGDKKIEQLVESCISGCVRANNDDLTFTVEGVSFVMKPVAGGWFNMGSINGESNEKPEHKVWVDNFYIAETEVTQALWEAVMKKTIKQQRKLGNRETWRLRGRGDDYPMYYISWNDCQDFIAELNLKTGKNFRMPTEAEWEYAARGGKGGENAKFSGSFSIEKVARYGRKKASHVKTKKPNVLGLYDMSGNVWEWCNDRYGEYIVNDTVNPHGPSYGSEYVIRGGGWGSNVEDYCRVSYRNSSLPESRWDDTGLRLCISL
jgi:formylglycine-generating enzyme required for sulfatase activity